MAIRNEFAETVSGEAPEGWERGHVTIQLKDPDEKVAVEAWRKGAFAIHEIINPVRARLTHAPTGLQIYSTTDAATAAEFAARIEPFTNWDDIKERMPSGSDLYPKVRQVRWEFEARGD